MTFIADFAGSIVVEAATYGYPTLKFRGNNKPVAVGLHTPEENPDDEPSTPYYFHNLTGRNASTTYFVAWTGLVFQCVPEDAGAYGNALEGKPRPPWMTTNNLNLETISIEIEGFAATIHQTMPRGSPQWISLVRLIADICRRRPAVRLEWTFGHYLVSIYRSDPGQLDIAALRQDVQLLLGGLEYKMPKPVRFDGEVDIFLPCGSFLSYIQSEAILIDHGFTAADVRQLPRTSPLFGMQRVNMGQMVPNILAADARLEGLIKNHTDNHPSSSGEHAHTASVEVNLT
jgi:N-acetylmuramoyl-L-alanine amidase